MCPRLKAAGIAVPSGDRLGLRAFSAARPDEGLQVYSFQRNPIDSARPIWTVPKLVSSGLPASPKR